MKYKPVLTRIMIAPLFLGLVTSCYDLGELNENPYEIKDATVYLTLSPNPLTNCKNSAVNTCKIT